MAPLRGRRPPERGEGGERGGGAPRGRAGTPSARRRAIVVAAYAAAQLTVCAIE